MRITSISAENYLVHRGLNIAIDSDANVLLVCGKNGSGKTAIAQAIKLAMSGEPVRGLAYKNQLGELISQGEKDGSVFVTCEVTTSSGEKFSTESSTSLRSGAHKGAFEGCAISLDPPAFFALDAKQRRQLLFGLAGIKLNIESTAAELVKQGHAAERVEKIKHHLRVGFEAGAEAARNEASEARGAWKAITGETYGEVKAQTWTAPKPKDAPSDPLETLQQNAAAAEQVHAKREAHRATLRENAAAWRNVESATKAKAALAANNTRLGQAQGQRLELRAELELLEKNAQHKGGETCACPSCGVVLFWNAKGELKEWEKVKPSESPTRAFEKLKAKRDEQTKLDEEIGKLLVAVESGESAQQLLSSLPKQPSDEDMRKADTDLANAKTMMLTAQSELARGKDADAVRRGAEEKTAKALGYHADVSAYAALSTAVQNLPAQYMAKVLVDVNGLCAMAAAAFDKPVVMGEDMEPRYGTIPYALCSDSEQWRVRCAMAYAIARLSGVDVMVLDHFDVVEPAARGAILSFLMDAPVQSVVCATLKSKPDPATNKIQTYWLGA